ncbi:MAG: hypothetical protein QE484_15790 [Rhizobium sp.]|nr:hypothetical protein [Rhizobium sp.]
MSQMPIFLRAYFSGLRAVQRAVHVYGANRTDPWSSWAAVRVAADWICMPPRKLGYKDIRHLDTDIRHRMAVTASEEAEFVRGYLAGFDGRSGSWRLGDAR